MDDERARQEHSLASSAERIKQLKAKQGQIKKNQEYQALTHEIQLAEDSNAKHHVALERVVEQRQEMDAAVAQRHRAVEERKKLFMTRAGKAKQEIAALQECVRKCRVLRKDVARTINADALALYEKLHDPANGYFSPEGIPYHSIEELIVEAPDWGHQTTSEGMSYYLWLEAQYGRITGEWDSFNEAWEVMEKYMIPSRDKFKFGGYNTSDGSDYAPEGDTPREYPVTRDPDVKVGADPIYSELKSAYGDGSLYSMHWLIDTDNA
jgi:hypothetical protein